MDSEVWDGQSSMIRGLGNAIIAVVAAALLDKYVYDSHYADAALAMLQQIRHSFGL
jgi:hypothetical protein